jgi:hypothetical protein
MHNEHVTIEAVLGTVTGGGQPPVRGQTAKLASIKLGEPESYYLLASYCFDLQRKLLYFCKVARPYLEHIPPDLEREIEEDTEKINAPTTWKGRAEAAEEVMLRLQRELESAPVAR